MTAPRVLVSRPGLLALAASLFALACATPVPSSSLPDVPLAFVHRTLAQGRERAEVFEKQSGAAVQSGEGMLKLNELGDMIDRMTGAASRMSPELQGEVALYHPRTGRIEPITAFVPGAIPYDWSGGHTRLLVATRQRGVPRLFEFSTERRDLAMAVLPSEGAAQISGSYGPDGRIAYGAARREGERLSVSIWATRPGGPDEQITPGPQDSRPRWSPDGSVLLFEGRLRNGTPVIQVLDLNDPLAEPRVIARGREACFTPSGDQVVYSRERREGWRLWRMRPDGSGKTALGHATQGDADERHPTVSPDGEYVAYVAEEASRQRIRIRRMDGAGDRLLIEKADGTLPVW